MTISRRLGCTLIITIALMACGPQPLRLQDQPPPNATTRTAIFDEAARAPKYASAIAEADRDLPGDQWSSLGPRENISRNRRVAVIARNILLDLRPRFRRMTVTELMRCLKVEDGTGFVTNYIADPLYAEGNSMIIFELKSRPPAERRVLLYWPRDGAYVDTGSDGESRTVDELVHGLLPQGHL